MKTTFARKTAFAGAFIASLFTASTYAGPSDVSPNPAPAASRSANNGPSAQICSECRTQPLQEPVYGYFPGGESDDYRVQWITVGAKHTCRACGGEMKSVQGKTTNAMQANCPVCAQAAPSCCKISG